MPGMPGISIYSKEEMSCIAKCCVSCVYFLKKSLCLTNAGCALGNVINALYMKDEEIVDRISHCREMQFPGSIVILVPKIRRTNCLANLIGDRCKGVKTMRKYTHLL